MSIKKTLVCNFNTCLGSIEPRVLVYRTHNHFRRSPFSQKKPDRDDPVHYCLVGKSVIS